jgi:DNA-binding NtrC family response regulator
VKPVRLFVVDDDPQICSGLNTLLEKEYQVSTFAAGSPALDAVRREPPDLVLLDLGLPDRDGLEVLDEVRAHQVDLPVIIVTGHQEIELAVQAIKRGAFDFATKPLHFEELTVSIRNALHAARLRREVSELHARMLAENVPQLIGQSDSLQDVQELIRQVAISATTPVLILGETGTGKELIARAIHYRSANADRPLVTVNCAAIPAELIESELFGYAKGAFSGASAAGKPGLVEQAAGGSLFLDEVADLGLSAQAKLLRFLENGEFYRVGGTRPVKVQTRVISATNRDLEERIRQNLFRADLFYRLAVVKLRIPALDQRQADILPLARHFLAEFQRAFGKPLEGFAPEAEQCMLQHRWRGNIRELKNAIERGVLVSHGPRVTVRDLGLASAADEGDARVLSEDGLDLQRHLEDIERGYLGMALQRSQGNQSLAARLLHMNHHTFRYRLRKLGLK